MKPIFSTNSENNTGKRKRRRRIGEFSKEIKEFKNNLSRWDRIKFDVQLGI